VPTSRSPSSSRASSRTTATQSCVATPRPYIEGFHAASADDIGVAGLLRAEAGASGVNETAFRFAHGYDRVPAWLHAPSGREALDVRLRTVVERLEWERGRVTVHARAATVRRSRAWSRVRPWSRCRSACCRRGRRRRAA
jgi:hypothetical protein